MGSDTAGPQRLNSRNRGLALPLVLFFVVVVTGLATLGFGLVSAGLRAERSAFAGMTALARGEAQVLRMLASLDRGTVMESLDLVTIQSLVGPDSVDLLEGLSPDLALAISRRSGPAIGILAKRSGDEVWVDRAVTAPAPGEVVIGPEAVIDDEVSALCLDNGVSWDSLPVVTSTDPYQLSWWKDRVTKSLEPGVYRNIGPSVSDGQCENTIIFNWGAPGDSSSPCATYRPVSFAAGDLMVIGGRGQGILIVGGDLTISGGFRFEGLVIVDGALRTLGEGGTVLGAVVVHGSPLSVALLGSGGVVFAPCLVARMVAGTAPVRPLGRRSWLQLY